MNFGWVPNPREVERILQQLPSPFFGAAAPHLQDSGKGKDVFLWKAEEQLTGKVRLPHNQKLGDCVSHGFSGAVDDLRFVRIAWYNDTAEDFVETSSEAIYGGARIEIGKGQCGVQDGAVGAWAADWLLKYGIIPRLSYNVQGIPVDLTQYSPALAKLWGIKGVPSDLENVAREYPAKTVSLVSSWEEVRDAIAGAKCPVTICSNQGFTTTRDANGFCSPQSVWQHCTYFRGISDNPKRPGGAYQQSWGEGMPTGPLHVTLPHGLELDMPEGCFFVDAEIIDRMVKQGDSFVIADIIGYPARPDTDFEFQLY